MTLYYVDASQIREGHVIGVVDVGGQLVAHAFTRAISTAKAELRAVELAATLGADMILTDCLQSVRQCGGRKGEALVCWIPRAQNIAHKPVSRARYARYQS